MNAKMPVRVLIAVPSFRGTVMIHTLQSLIHTVGLFGELGIQVEFINIDSAEITIARNTMATYAWRKETITHLLFVDDDMTFEPDAVIDLLRHNQPLIGCIYPKRVVSMERIWEAGKAGLSLNEALTEGSEFVTPRLPSSGQLEVREGVIEVEGLGMGVTLIRREVLTTLVDQGKVERRRLQSGGEMDAFGNTFVWGFFDAVEAPDGSYLLSEDLSFCHRWREIGGKVYGTVDRKIGHIGSFIFAGRYLDRLKMGKV